MHDFFWYEQTATGEKHIPCVIHSEDYGSKNTWKLSELHLISYFSGMAIE